MKAVSKVTRPVLRYHGGKWKLAPWIIEHFPKHRIYVEPFGGGASVLMRKERSYAEVYNDLDGEVVNVFRVLRDPRKSVVLEHKLRLTPWSRVEFQEAYRRSKNDVEQARRTVVKCFMGFGTTAMRKSRTGFRAKPYRDTQSGVKDWTNYPAVLSVFTQRLFGVTLENRSALDVIAMQDAPDTLFYVDPPYTQSTRSSLNGGTNMFRAYSYDMTDTQHRELAKLLHSVKGMVVLSSYKCGLYDKELYAGWYRITRQHLADGGRKRTEVLWLNDAAASRIPQKGFDFRSAEQPLKNGDSRVGTQNSANHSERTCKR
ncbi:MAG TPA: DNA adenine methylase [Candidatus Angelobacter sp.]